MFSWRLDNDHASAVADDKPLFTGAKAIYKVAKGWSPIQAPTGRLSHRPKSGPQVRLFDHCFGRLAQLWDVSLVTTPSGTSNIPPRLTGVPTCASRAIRPVFHIDAANNKQSIFAIASDGELTQVGTPTNGTASSCQVDRPQVQGPMPGWSRHRSYKLGQADDPRHHHRQFGKLKDILHFSPLANHDAFGTTQDQPIGQRDWATFEGPILHRKFGELNRGC